VSIAVLTPFTGAKAKQAGGRWRKRLLPIGEINYQGRVLKFTRGYLADLVNSFKASAYDQVPFQLAGADNKHTNDVERTGGQITDMTLGDDGLYIEVVPTSRGQAVLEDNPGVGVSARIVEQFDRSDGKFFPRAVQHVLCTLDPRIPGMGGWEAVAAANDVSITFDLSGAQFTGDVMPELTADQQDKLAKLLDLDPDKLAALLEAGGGTGITQGAAGALNGDPATPPAPPAGDEDAELDQIAAAIDAMSDEDLAALEAELDAQEGGQQQQGAPATAGAGLSNPADGTAMAIELAQAGVDENARQLGIITAQLDNERWQNERRKLVGAGTPPFIADLAQPLLEGAGHVVDLANGKSVDAGQIVRRILAEYQKLGQQLGIGVELGSEMDEPEGDTAAEEARNDVLRRARAQLFQIRTQ
jgi:hypothetical protein